MGDLAKNVWEIKISRRDFIKKAVIGTVAAGASIYGISKILPEKEGEKIDIWQWSKEAHHYLKLGRNVRCNLCPNRCLLENNERSICQTKVNKNGKLYTLAYGNPCSIHVDPIEKKPLFHFLPTSTAFSIATAGCNFSCLNCQNWQISQFRPEETQNYSLFPDEAVQEALKYGCKSIAYTYSEPTAFYEYMYDTSKIANENNMKNLWITNGYINEEPLIELCRYIDAANVDLKGFNESFYNTNCSGTLQPVLNTLKTLKKQGVWFEVTNLIIPTLNDDMEEIKAMCDWIINNIGKDYPLHFSRFHPYYKLTNLPQTPIKTLEEARNTAIEKGIKYVYIGNVPKHEAENTYCPYCKKILIKRTGYTISENNITDGKCKFCNEKISGVWA